MKTQVFGNPFDQRVDGLFGVSEVVAREAVFEELEVVDLLIVLGFGPDEPLDARADARLAGISLRLGGLVGAVLVRALLQPGVAAELGFQGQRLAQGAAHAVEGEAERLLLFRRVGRERAGVQIVGQAGGLVGIARQEPGVALFHLRIGIHGTKVEHKDRWIAKLFREKRIEPQKTQKAGKTRMRQFG